ncbi:uncharacterized protein LOC141897140 isoform X1 [Acropora palmata]|uniref:uncharacterized protein LOC141897140 isoform X1 n=1 Tax=Acropora palmata TaxID=6131 RepID=UPI003DA0809C
MQSLKREVSPEKYDMKYALIVEDYEKVRQRRERPNPTRERLLRRTKSSQSLLSNNNEKELDVKYKPQDPSISSSTTSLLFTRSSSSSSKEELQLPKRRSRARSFSGTSSNKEEWKTKQLRSANTTRKTSSPSSPRRSSYFGFQSIQRSLNVEEESKWQYKKDCRGKGRPSSQSFLMGMITSMNKEEKEKNRKLALVRFRRAAFLVRTFTSLYLSVRKYADQDKTRQYDLYYIRDMLPDYKNSPTLMRELPVAFNKHLFSRENTLHFPLWARMTCEKEPENRSETEVNNLVALLRGMKSFNKFSREAQRYVCRTMTYACYERRRIIVRQGHPGFSFFFIVSGSVSVTITRKDEKTGIDITNTVDVLLKNETFGEIALISEEAKRTATIICRERVEVVAVNRETILKYCPDVFQREYDEKIQVMRSHPLFDGWTEDLLRSLTYHSHIREFSYGKLVDIDSSDSESIYFIIKGKMEMLRRVDLRAAVITEDKVKNFIHDKSLLHSTAVFSRKSGKNASYVNVGSLQAKDSWDLTTLDHVNHTGHPGNILVSAGVRVLKVPKRIVIELMPKGHMETFQKNFFLRQRCLTEEEVFHDYLAAETWLEYRKKVVQSVIDVKKRISASSKDSTG